MKMQYLQYGSPTAELFAASYNNRSNKSNTIELIAGEIGYYNNTKEGFIELSVNTIIKWLFVCCACYWIFT